MTRIPFQNTFLQPYSNKFKIAVIITILTVVMVVVPYVYSSIVKQKTEVLNVSTSVLTQLTEISSEVPDVSTSVLTQITKIPTVQPFLIIDWFTDPPRLLFGKLK